MRIDPAAAPAARKPENTPADPEKKKLKEACRNFEAIFVAQMLKEMRPEGDDPVFGGSHQRKIYESMMDEQMAEHLTRERSPLGVGDLLYRQLVEKLSAAAPKGADYGTEPAHLSATPPSGGK